MGVSCQLLRAALSPPSGARHLLRHVGRFPASIASQRPALLPSNGILLARLHPEGLNGRHAGYSVGSCRFCSSGPTGGDKKEPWWRPFVPQNSTDVKTTLKLSLALILGMEAFKWFTSEAKADTRGKELE